MKRRLSCYVLALATLSSPAAGALESARAASTATARVVELRVSGDAAAVARVRVTARELLSRLDVQPSVKAIDEPETSAAEPPPLVVAYLDLRTVSSPSIDIEDGQTRQELTRRHLSEVPSLETGVESLLHVLYLTVESALQVAAAPPAPARVAPRPKARAATRRPVARPVFGLDLGALLRVSSLGASRLVPGGGLVVEPRVNLGRSQAGVMLSAALHASSGLTFERGEATVRPLQLRVVPTWDWLVSSDVSGCVGLGAGLDSLMVEPVQAPDVGFAAGAQTALDPVLSALLGARLPISGRAFLSALASLDYDVAPTSFVARDATSSRPLLQLPRLRAGFTLALSFTAAGGRRFAAAGVEQ
ncbi:MAG: hypothetical protein EOO73_07795 [Myxococcales bacterium]|nr:MAG: hypothetical protein EOO73_07795 [Myxococcales bacterium]